MTTFQDTRSRSTVGVCKVVEGTKHSSQPKFNYYTYSGGRSGLQQTVTSVRTTSKPVPRLISEIETREFLFGRDLKKVMDEDRATLVPRFTKKLGRKIWYLCNPNPCEMIKNEATSTPSKKITILGAKKKNDPSWSWYDYSWEGDIGGLVLSQHLPLVAYQNLPPSTDLLRDLALTKTYALAKSPVLPIQVYLGELGDTLSMLRNPLNAIQKFFRGQRSSKPFRDLADTGAGTWLEYRYGWMPLVFQVEEIIDALNFQLNNGFPIHLVRGGERRIVLDKEEIRNSRVCAQLYVSYMLKQKASVKASAVLATRQTMSQEKFLGNRWSDLVSTAWELKTLSFVWDWFINIGEWLQAIVPDPDLRVIANSVSLKREYKVSASVRTYGLGPQYVNIKPQSDSSDLIKEASYVESGLSRVVNLPLPRVPIARRQLLSYARIADSLSLTIGEILRSLPKGLKR